MANTKKSSDESIKTSTPQTHTYTPRSHENLLRNFSKNKIKNECVKDFSRENEYLKKELNNSKKQLQRLKRRLMVLESNNRKKVKDSISYLNAVPESRSEIQPEIEVDNDDDFVKSWEVLGDHFSKVIRKHHDVLAEKDRQIRELQEKQYTREISSRLLNYSKDNMKKGILNEESRDLAKEKANLPLESGGTSSKLETDTQNNSYQCEDECKCTEISVSTEDCLIHSGQLLSAHFSEVIRRHRQELREKDQQIQELQQALEQCTSRKTTQKQGDESEVQMWYHDYIYHSQPSVTTGDQVIKLVPSSEHFSDTCDSLIVPHSKNPPVANSVAVPNMSQPMTPTTSGDSLSGSTDTFVVIEKCQRLESIANLERLRQNIMQRLKLEEKLDRLYWQTELDRYQVLREEAGDSFDSENSLNKDMDMLESTRLELLTALSKVKDSAERGPEIFVKPHLPFQDSENIVKSQLQLSESENIKRVKFREEITITTVQTTYEES